MDTCYKGRIHDGNGYDRGPCGMCGGKGCPPEPRKPSEIESLRTENAALKARLAAAEKVIERLGRCGRVTAQFDFGTPEGIKFAAIYRWDEFDKVKEAIAAYDAESK